MTVTIRFYNGFLTLNEPISNLFITSNHKVTEKQRLYRSTRVLTIFYRFCRYPSPTNIISSHSLPRTDPSHVTIFTKFCFTLNSFPLLHFSTRCIFFSFFPLDILPPSDGIVRRLSSLLCPIVLISPFSRSYSSQRFFFPSLSSAPPILPVQNFPLCSPVPSFSNSYSRFNIPTLVHLSLSLSLAMEVHQATCVSSLPLLMTVLH